MELFNQDIRKISYTGFYNRTFGIERVRGDGNMEQKINRSIFIDEAPVLKFTISGREAYIKNVFTIESWKIMSEEYEQSGDYRYAFVKAVYYMYQRTDKDKKHDLTVDDFKEVSDELLVSIIENILDQDERIKADYDKVKEGSPFERFYIGSKMFMVDFSKNPSDRLAEVSKTLKLFSESIEKTFKSVNDVGLNSIVSSFDNISKPLVNFEKLFAPIQAASKRMIIENTKLINSYTVGLKSLRESLEKIYSSVDFSMLTYYKEWSEQRKTIVEYGWFYSREFPEELMNEIYEKRQELSKDDVNLMIVTYFRKNKCKAIKDIIEQWNKLLCFDCRQGIFKEALENHIDGRYNSSVTLLTLHIEGVITDFFRINLQQPRYRVQRAIDDINQTLEDEESMSIYEHIVFNDVIKNIEESFTESFDCANPDISSNGLRHKIAHGHVYEKENEVNSLKRFLYINELYHMFVLYEENL